MCTEFSYQKCSKEFYLQIEKLKEQLHLLKESQSGTEEKYRIMKQENNSLTDRIHGLEESVQEMELKEEQRINEIQKKNKEAVERMERDKQIEIENYSNKLQDIEAKQAKMIEEGKLIRADIERTRKEKSKAEEQLLEAQTKLAREKEQHQQLQNTRLRELEQWQEEKGSNMNIVQELSKEVISDPEKN